MLDKFTIYDFWRRQVQFPGKALPPLTENETFSSLGQQCISSQQRHRAQRAGKARPGDIVNIEGWLVDVTKPGGWEMRTGITG